jgi:hypothetical protein
MFVCTVCVRTMRTRAQVRVHVHVHVHVHGYVSRSKLYSQDLRRSPESQSPHTNQGSSAVHPFRLRARSLAQKQRTQFGGLSRKRLLPASMPATTETPARGVRGITSGHGGCVRDKSNPSTLQNTLLLTATWRVDWPRSKYRSISTSSANTGCGPK